MTLFTPPPPGRFQPVSRAERETRLRQRGRAIWFYGLSGAGKSTLATRLERHLHGAGCVVHLLDGDAVRAGLNSDLGFDEASRSTNIRRLAEVARLFVDAGVVVICAAITPMREHRRLARALLGDDLLAIHVSASFDACARRDPKGLYRRALAGQIPAFTGLGSQFEVPDADDPVLHVETECESVEASLARVIEAVTPFIVTTAVG